MADRSDMKAHVSTYNGVMSFLKWGTIVSAIVVAAVVWIIAS